MRGASKHLLAEMERSIHDALCILTQTIRESKVVLGGGCCELLMAESVANGVKLVTGKEALAMDAYARALTQIPAILADNAGFDAADIITSLRSEHSNGNHWMGVYKIVEVIEVEVVVVVVEVIEVVVVVVVVDVIVVEVAKCTSSYI